MIGIIISIFPLLLVMVVTNGMIEGIINHTIENSTYHLQVSYPQTIGKNEIFEQAGEIEKLDSVKIAFPERSGVVFISAKEELIGTEIKAIAPDLYQRDKNLQEYLTLSEGNFNLVDLPFEIAAEVFETMILPKLKDDHRAILLKCYEKMQTSYQLQTHRTIEDVQKAKSILSTVAFDKNIVIGKGLAQLAKIGPGDLVFLITFKQLGQRQVFKTTRFIVTGIISTGYQDIDKYLGYISYDLGRKLLVSNNDREYLGIKVNDPFTELNRAIGQIQNKLGGISSVFHPISTWYELRQTQYQSYQSIKTLLVFIMILIVMVASVNVYSSIMMLTMEKSQEIAILKSMGMSRKNIALIFMFLGFLCGLIGALGGIIGGLIVAVNINEVIKTLEIILNQINKWFYILFKPILQLEEYHHWKILNPDFYLQEIPVSLSFLEVSGVLILTVTLATFAAYLPANRAGKIKPLDIIRKY
ncbi:MAG: ABC transporter permease [Spirochaetales bacterium]|nr:ABC transporter permease [Spirochaetales bacterium]